MLNVEFYSFENHFSETGQHQYKSLSNLIKAPIKVVGEDLIPIVRFQFGNPNRTPLEGQLYTAIVLDIDECDLSPKFINQSLELIGLESYIHTTRSHNKEKACFRVILPLRYPRSYQEVRDLRALICEELAIKSDPRCEEPTRGYYAPMKTHNYECFENQGLYVDECYAEDINNIRTQLLKERMKQVKLSSTEKASSVATERPLVSLGLEGSVAQEHAIDGYEGMIDLWSQKSVQLLVSQALGYIPSTIRWNDDKSSSFRSPLYSHEDLNPSWNARWDSEQNKIQFYSHASGRVYDLIDLYFANHTKSDGVLSGPSRAVWLARLLADTGLMKPVDIAFAKINDDAPASAKSVWDSVKRLFTVKWSVNYGLSSACSCRFLASWSGLSISTISRGLSWLKKEGLILRDEVFQTKHGRGLQTVIPALSYGAIRG